MRKYKFLLVACTGLLLVGCASYYRINQRFNDYFLSGNMMQAGKVLDSGKNPEKRKDKLIYFMNKGIVEFMKNQHSTSNVFFERAHQLIDSYHTNYLNEGLALLTNSDFVEYRGEDFEHLYVYYFKALNYLKLGDNSSALVECRRMNNKLNYINDKYNGKNTLRKNAFMHLLMGLIYEANGEFNNAFIAYRNAADAYDTEFSKYLGIECPEQLKRDLLKSAYLSGLDDELQFYSKQFNLNFDKSWLSKEPQIVMLWHSGMCPVKEEWSINFTVLPGLNMVTFANAEMGLNFSFPMSSDEYQKNGFSELRLLRVAFPKFVERTPIYRKAMLTIDNVSNLLAPAESINAIAFKTLNDRMLMEVGKSLLRLATKKAAELAIRKSNQNAGALVGIFNAITEKADTRQWAVLPHGIQYARVNAKLGEQDLRLELSDVRGQRTIKNIKYKVPDGISFYTYSTLDFMPIYGNYNQNGWQDYR